MGGGYWCKLKVQRFYYVGVGRDKTVFFCLSVLLNLEGVGGDGGEGEEEGERDAKKY